jgi:F420H(2)-dependent quinone reductase
VQVGTAKMKARARTATGEERARLWEKALEFWPVYADLQRKTEREIPWSYWIPSPDCRCHGK